MQRINPDAHHCDLGSIGPSFLVGRGEQTVYITTCESCGKDMAIIARSGGVVRGGGVVQCSACWVAENPNRAKDACRRQPKKKRCPVCQQMVHFGGEWSRHKARCARMHGQASQEEAVA